MTPFPPTESRLHIPYFPTLPPFAIMPRSQKVYRFPQHPDYTMHLESSTLEMVVKETNTHPPPEPKTRTFWRTGILSIHTCSQDCTPGCGSKAMLRSEPGRKSFLPERPHHSLSALPASHSPVSTHPLINSIQCVQHYNDNNYYYHYYVFMAQHNSLSHLD